MGWGILQTILWKERIEKIIEEIWKNSSIFNYYFNGYKYNNAYDDIGGCMIFIRWNTPSSKNSKQWTGKFLINSKTTREYIKATKNEWLLNKNEFLEMLKGKEKPYKIELYFIRDSKRKFDYINVAQIVFDLMQEYEYIENDDCINVIPIFKGYRVDKANAGVEINILN